MAWYIVGEAGKALDATPRLVFSQLKVTNLKLRFESLGLDSLSWIASGKDIASTDTIVPEPGQVVELWDGLPGSGGTRRFHGHAASPKGSLYRVSVQILGPWWWLTRTPLTSTQTSPDGNSAERTTYRFASGSVSAMISAVIARAIALGCPLVAGTVDASYAIPQVTASLTTCADALALLMRWIPDAVSWFDYTVAGNPRLNINRRGTMATITYNVSTGDLSDMDVGPRVELVTSEVSVNYVERNPTSGKAKYLNQTAGSGGAGTRNIIEVSGPLLDTFLPKDDFESFALSTRLAGFLDATTKEQILSAIPDITAVRAAFGGSPKTTDLIFANGETFGPFYELSSFTSATPALSEQPEQITWTSPAGAPVDARGKYVSFDANLPSWLSGLGFQPAIMTGWLVQLQVDYGLAPPYGVTSPVEYVTPPGWVQRMPWTRGVAWFGPGGGHYDHKHISFNAYKYQVPCLLTDQNIGAKTRFYRPSDYTFIAPPAGMAAGLLAAQNWLPWEGYLDRKGTATVSGINLLANCYNVTNGPLAGAASMRALPKAVEYSFETLSCRIELGSPPRYDFRSLANSIRANAQDNIVMITT